MLFASAWIPAGPIIDAQSRRRWIGPGMNPQKHARNEYYV